MQTGHERAPKTLDRLLMKNNPGKTDIISPAVRRDPTDPVFCVEDAVAPPEFFLRGGHVGSPIFLGWHTETPKVYN